MKKKLFILTLTFASLLLFGGCGQSKAVETTDNAEETTEAAEAEVAPTPEPTVEPTPEPTPTPVVELPDEEVIPASLEAWNNAQHYLFNELFSGDFYAGYAEDATRQVAYDRENGAVAIIANDYNSYYCNGMVYSNNGEEKLYSLCDDNKSFNPHDLFDDETCQTEFLVALDRELSSTSDSEGSNFVYGADKYYVAHDWTSDTVNPDDYYLIESYNTDLSGDGTDIVVAYSAYYVNKATLLPDYYTTSLYFNMTDEETGESSTIVKDDDGNIIEFTGTPIIASTGEFVYFDDEAAQTGDNYDTYVYMTTFPTDDQLLTGDDLAAYVTAYEEANPDLFAETE